MRLNRAAQDAVLASGNESRADRSMNLNELASLLSMTPNAEGNSQLQAPDLASMIYNKYNQDSANSNNARGGLADLASTGLMAWGSNGFKGFGGGSKPNIAGQGYTDFSGYA